jgi:hypothetical protein
MNLRLVVSDLLVHEALKRRNGEILKSVNDIYFMAANVIKSHVGSLSRVTFAEVVVAFVPQPRPVPLVLRSPRHAHQIANLP